MAADKVLKEKRMVFVQSVTSGTINGLLDDLLEKRVLNQEEMEKVRRENATDMDKARALIDSVTRKGDKASKVCIDHICEIDSHLAEKMGLPSGAQSRTDHNTQYSQAEILPFPAPQAVQDNPAKLAFPGPGGSLKLCPPDIAQKIWNEKSAEIYPIMGKFTRTRLALIICNTEFDKLSRRAGADADIRGMKMLLEDLGYTVDVKEDLTASDMKAELSAFAARKEHKTSDSTFVVFMSHGIREGICGKKHSKEVSDVLDIDTIFQSLNTYNCPSLKDKPKVIIIQACRGENEGVVWLKDSAKGSENDFSLAPEDFEYDAIKKAHIEKDFIAFCSSTPDNVSWRHPKHGSLFIMKLIKNLREYAWSCDMEEIFRKVRFSFESPDGKAQMPTTERVTLTRCFYLFPGHFEGVFVFLTDKLNKNPLKALESIGKDLLVEVLDGLVKKDVLKLEETEKKKFNDAKPGDKARVLVDAVRGRHHEAGQALVQTFLNTNKNSISTKVPAVPPKVTEPPESAETTDTLKLCPPEEFQKVCEKRAGEIYPIKERKDRTRLALIICNREFDHLQPRKGAELDITGMTELLKGLGYTVIVEENLTAKEMESVLVEFAARPEHRTSDSTFLVFMSHGLLDRLCGKQHSKENPDVLPYDTIFRVFNNRNCPSLKDKPKVIIVQACRGENRGELWVSDSPAAVTDSTSQSPENLEDDAVYKAHVEKDFIAFCSSTPHNVSWRDTTKGSLFITQLIGCFQKYSWCCHLEEVFRKVQLSFEKPEVRVQMPTIERLSMSRYFYLFPGN
ncbi:caspase-1-like [Myotis lucifugus]|uniref:caspase-1-like n=1 Tax=Myotis lucifugus TaxID=59463 RepID=UPI000CCC0793|nr:caspase-1-like [Myotis lucifugus]